MRKRSAGRKSSESPGKGGPRGVERATLGGVGLRIAVGSSEADLKRRSALPFPFVTGGSPLFFLMVVNLHSSSVVIAEEASTKPKNIRRGSEENLSITAHAEKKVP